jgi:hypothetical protein
MTGDGAKPFVYLKSLQRFPSSEYVLGNFSIMCAIVCIADFMKHGNLLIYLLCPLQRRAFQKNIGSDSRNIYASVTIDI